MNNNFIKPPNFAPNFQKSRAGNFSNFSSFSNPQNSTNLPNSTNSRNQKSDFSSPIGRKYQPKSAQNSLQTRPKYESPFARANKFSDDSRRYDQILWSKKEVITLDGQRKKFGEM